MKIIIDNKIPYIKGVFEPFAQVLYLAGSDTTAHSIKESDALITRTRTICNETTLKGSKVKMIATATIGFDHIDTAYCAANDIEWTNAPGCNSSSVEQYIFAALAHLSIERGFKLKGKTLGIVGVGNVGRKVARIAQILGMRVLLNDPPRERNELGNQFVDLPTIQREADIITLHTPLNSEGADATYHLADANFFSKLEQRPIFINTCRGEVVDTSALKQALTVGSISGAVIDCWECEPNIDRQLLKMVNIATPHIAGYSRDGKANGTQASVQAISRFFNLGIDHWQPTQIELPSEPILRVEHTDSEELIKQLFIRVYPITDDDTRLRNDVDHFEKQRGDYPVRREYPAYTVVGCKNEELKNKLKDIGFNVEQ